VVNVIRAGSQRQKLTKAKKCRNAHSPTLETVLMVEQTLKELGTCTITELYRSLPRTVIYPTLRLIIEYFYAKGFIASDSKGKIVWVYNPGLVRRYSKKPGLLVR